MPRGRPIKRSKPVSTEHVIHEDGSYTNASSVAQPEVTPEVKPVGKFAKWKKELKLNAEIKLKGERVGFAYCIYPNGIYVKPKRSRNPDLGECRHISWEILQRDLEG